MLDWKQHEGELAGGEFPLERYLAGSEAGAHFLTRFASGRAVVKLVLAGQARAAELVERWNRAAALRHPHLVSIFAAGTWTLAGMPLAYFVMEYAERNLAEVLRERPGVPARPGHGAWQSETFEYSGGRRHSQTFQRDGVGGRPGGEIVVWLRSPEPTARNTIHGKATVVVGVAVDASGNVAKATLEPGGSSYFGALALEAARHWQFAAVKGAGPRNWTLRFEIAPAETQVIPVRAGGTF